MRVRLICGENINHWILGKFAIKLEFELRKLGHDVDISDTPDLSADINHYIIYLHYKSIQTNSINTLMITHVDNLEKLYLLRDALKLVEMGICMSSETRNLLINSGLPSQKLNFIVPAHDEVMKRKKIIIGLTCRVYADGRKREYFIKAISNVIDNTLFSFKIMGSGWDEYVEFLIQKGFEVQYHNTFDYKIYTEIIPSLDYYLYMGMDEGQMGCIDALAAGVKTIVTRQGYHLNLLEGITHAFETKDELINIFKTIENDAIKKRDAVKYWTWPFYAEKHLELWNYLIEVKQKRNIIIQPKNYTDGVFSIVDSPIAELNFIQKATIYVAFKKKSFAQLCHIYISLIVNSVRRNGIFFTFKRICHFLFKKF